MSTHPVNFELPQNFAFSPTSILGPYRAADYWQLGDEPCELIYGRFIVSPAPSPLHQLVSSMLWQVLFRIARRTGGVALEAIDAFLADHSIVQPDVIYLTAARRSIVTRRGIDSFPDLAVEVLSTVARRDRVEKLKLYAESRVPEYWIVDPEQQQIDFLVNVGGKFEMALAKENVYRSDVTPEIEIDLAAFWCDVDSVQLP